VAQHETERRRRMAASAGTPLDRTLASATRALFQSVMHLDELATRAQNRVAEPSDAAALRAVLDRMNEALLHCDQLAVLVDHLQRLLEPARPAPRHLDLRQLLSLATYSARGLLPVELEVVNHVPALPGVAGDRAEIMQALIDVLVQIGTCPNAGGRLELHGGSEQGIVWVELRLSGAGASPRPGLALESAIETLARHRGALVLSPSRDEVLTLRMRLPAAR
jgi:hypothetical protein